jgi:hypothetical protein
MTIKDILRKTLLGLSVLQEYVCLESEALHTPLRLFVSASDSIVPLEVTAHHLFLGYKPLIIALCAPKGMTDREWLQEQKEICVTLDTVAQPLDTTWKGYPVSKTAIAKMILKKNHTLSLGETAVFFYEGSWGEHTLISGIHQFINRVKRKISAAKNAAITLDANLADQVRIAYAIPRIISLITVRDGSNMNMFPTDLHGPTGSGYYISSLRHSGKACEHVLSMKRVALSDVRSDQYRYVYGLGKNHMQEPVDPQHFKLADQATDNFKLPLPEGVLRYRELSVTDYFDAGIHRIIIYRIESDKEVMTGKRLSHMHQYAVQWRVDHQLSTPVLLR